MLYFSFLAAALQGHDLEKPQEQEGRLEVKRRLKQQDHLHSYIFQRMCGAYARPHLRGRCLMLTHCHQQRN